MTEQARWGHQVGILENEVANLRQSMLRVETRVEQIYRWLIGLMGGMISSMVLLILSMII
ncbi:MAG: hypothetical protein LRZ99_01915 [Desulfotomaculum sp.]|nr:hypothetical protein [Desulfotomaculum sp.]